MSYNQKHWSSVVNRAVVQRGQNGSFNLCIEGGSEYGQFVVIGDVLTDKVIYRSGSLTPGEIILEINSTHVAGYTQTDGIQLIKDSGNLLNITSVFPGLGITRDLRKYLGTRFQRGSVDHELQQTIRDNLYMRTVPCTTRKPREGEVPGVDYEFLTVNQYLELEKSGKLLESGFYESNYYGTPKPPKQPMTPGTGTLRRPKTKKPLPEAKKEDTSLPKNWEVAYTREGEPYFVDHNTGRTQWDDPRKKKKALSTSRLPTSSYGNNADDDDELPPGWEKVDDPKYGTYYIDHVNRRTQYERPEFPHKRKNSRLFNRSEPDPRDAELTAKKNLTIDAKKLQGETFRVSMRKGAKGFGFTIVGGEQPGEVLQVNNIVRGGAADVDGRLRTGDIIMRLNGRNVLSWSHAQIIRFLQGTRVGEVVELDLVRGYPLPFNPSDPDVKKVGSQGMSNGQDSIRRSASNISLGPKENGGSRGMMNNKSGYLSDGEGYKRNPERPGATTPVAFRSGPPQYTVVPVVRGPNGFGFTIADSPYGQRVKEIIDRHRCQGLLQGDVIIRINNSVVHNLDHVDVVETLKACPKGQTTNFQVQRSGVLTVVKSMPTPLAGKRQPSRPKSMPSFDGQLPTAPGVRSSTSMGVIATNGETSTVNNTTYEERNHPQVSSAGDGYKSLKRAVQSHSRETDGSSNSGAGFTDHVITLKRGDGGFGFRIIGGQEERTQVSVDTIVPNGAAEKDGRLRHGDIILAVDGVNVVDASHKKVISLMIDAGGNGQVTLRIRRKTESLSSAIPNNVTETRDGRSPSMNALPVRLINDLGESVPSAASHTRDRRKSDSESVHSDKQVAEWIEDQQRPRNTKPYREFQANGLRSKSESNLGGRPKSCPPPVAPKPMKTNSKEVLLSRNSNEGFGFVIMSSPSSNGSVIGRIIPGSPADRCGELSVDDKLLAVNDNDVSGISHSEIVSMVKNSGLQVKLLIDRPGENSRPNSQSDEVVDAPPRPAGPRNYVPATQSYNRQTDNLREEYQRQRQDLEESKMRDIRDRENRQPARPKSAPLSAFQRPSGNSSVQRVTVSSIDNGFRGSMTRDDRANIQESARRKISAGDTVSIILHRGERGFGFSIRGGEGMPLFVLRIAEGGPAYEDGRVNVGDEILEINGQNAEVMSHAEAVNTIRNCADTATLLLRRPLRPIVTSEERVPNGYSSQNELPRKAQFERPKSGYY